MKTNAFFLAFLILSFLACKSKKNDPDTSQNSNGITTNGKTLREVLMSGKWQNADTSIMYDGSTLLPIDTLITESCRLDDMSDFLADDKFKYTMGDDTCKMICDTKGCHYIDDNHLPDGKWLLKQGDSLYIEYSDFSSNTNTTYTTSQSMHVRAYNDSIITIAYTYLTENKILIGYFVKKK